MTLPQDILEEILSHLRFDLPSLKACLLTHPTFLLPSNRLLFAKVRVQNSRGPPTDICLELRKVLVASKYMTESIRSHPGLHLVSGRERHWHLSIRTAAPP